MSGLARFAAAGLRAARLDALLRAAADRGRAGGGAGWAARRTPPSQILIYHRVLPGSAPFAIDAIPPERFRAQMEHLARSYRVLPLEEIRTRALDGSLPRRAIAVTFDDGYADNHDHALPILRALGLPATVFLATACIGTGAVPWHDRVLRAFETTTRREADLPGEPAPTPLQDVAARRAAAFRLLPRLKPLEETERLAAVDRLVETLGTAASDAEPRRLMLSWEEVRAMRRGGFAVGSHTVTHPILSRQPSERAAWEIVESKRAIEEALGEPVTLFAYPNGRPEDYSPEIVAMVGRAGYRVAVTTSFGTNEAGDDPLRWRRGTPWEPDANRFALKLAYYRLAGPSGTPPDAAPPSPERGRAAAASA